MFLKFLFFVALFAVCETQSQIGNPKVFIRQVQRKAELLTRIPFDNLTNSVNHVKHVRDHLIKNYDEILDSVSVNQQCRKDLRDISSSNFSLNFKFWDSYAVPGTGFALFHTTFAGQPEECVNIKLDSSPVQSSFPDSGPFLVTFKVHTGLQLSLGTCMPLSCSNSQVARVFKYALHELGVNTEWVVADGREKFEATGAFITAVVVFGIILLLITVATTSNMLSKLNEIYKNGIQKDAGYNREFSVQLDDDRRNEQTVNQDEPIVNLDPVSSFLSLADRFLKCFDFYANFTKILTIPTKSSPGQQFPVLNGIRVLSLGWVMIGHTILVQTFMSDNFLYVYERGKNLLFQTIMNGTPSVDSFFVMSGLLVMYGSLKTMETLPNPTFGNPKFWIMFYVHRLIRLWPTILLTILFVVGIFPQLAPVFYSTFYQNELNTSLVGLCSGTKWMPTAFFFNNLDNPSQSCINWTWYVANDVQFFIISPLFIVAARMNKLWGYLSIGAVIAVNTLLVLKASGVNRAPPGDGGGAFVNPDIVNDFDFTTSWATERLYFSPYCRFQTYGIGLILGLALYQRDQIKSFFDRTPVVPRVAMIWGLWAFGFLCGIICVYGCYPYANGGHMGVWAAAFYNATFRVLWGIFLSILILLCNLGYGGVINDILSANFWIPFARVNYTTYIIHLMLLQMYAMTLEQDFHFTTLNYTLTASGLLMCLNCLGLVCSCIIEAPFIQLEKLILVGKMR